MEVSGSDHDLLIEMRTLLRRVLLDLSDIKNEGEESYSKLDGRVRALENFRWWVLGVCAACSLLGGVIGHLVVGK